MKLTFTHANVVDDPVGGNLHNWLPADIDPAWKLLQTKAETPNRIPAASHLRRDGDAMLLNA